MNTEIQTIVQYIKHERALSFRQFASGLTRFMMQGTVTYQTVKDWHDGEYEPSLPTLCEIVYFAPIETWQHKFAEQIISVVKREIDG